jgi:MoaA/NifB/PqqE/SkfB family radical SAM enzyme
MVNIGKSRQRWVIRKALEDDIYYDTDTRKVYRNGAHPVLDTSKDVYKLPTFDSRAPLKVYFDFTYLCNLECRHCISNSSPQVDRKDELSSERIVSIMNELANIGVLEIAIGGGEPLCHPDILSFLEHSRAIRSNIVLTTNGILITSAVAKRLKEYQISEVRVSFDGSQKVHDNIRGTGNYQKAIRAVKLLIRNGVMPVARLTVCNDDEFGLDMLFKDLHSIGVSTVKAAIVEPRGRAALKANQDLFRYKRDISIAEYLLELAQKYDLKLKLPADLASIPELADGEDLRLGKRKSCGAGLETAYISPYGDVQPCVGVTNRNFGNVRSDSFMSVWTSDSAKTWRQYACSHDSWKVCAQMEIFLNKEILSITEK